MAGKKAATGETEPTIFGLYQLKTGSYTLGDTRFAPLTVAAVPESTKELACEDNSPVKFFDTEDAAKEALAKLKTKFEAKPKAAE
jgi:hypothetical protein